jgi:anti-anti-sigma factor
MCYNPGTQVAAKHINTASQERRSMEIAVWHEQGRVDVTVFAIKGAITVESYEQLQERFEQEHKHGTKNLLIDLEEVPLISSSGLQAIHHIFLLLEKTDETTRRGISGGTFKSAHFKLLNPSKNTFSVLKMAGFDMFLDIYDDLEKAVASF